jgi:tetratricopeptide (TPR) repeat protein
MTSKARAKSPKSTNVHQNVSGPVPSKRAVAKKPSNPASTGGAGVTFENRVQAVRLLGLALGTVTPGIPGSGRIVGLQFQAKRANGPNTDDLVCSVEGTSGQRYRVLMQMKRGLTARPSDTAFSESVGNAWLDYIKRAFKRGMDRILIVHDSGSTHEMRGAHEVARSAITSLDATDWIVKLTAASTGNAAKRNALTTIRGVIVRYSGSAISDDEFLQFMKSLSFLPHDLDSEGTAEHVNHVNVIHSAAMAVGVQVDAQLVWARLVTACMRLNSESGAVDYSNLAEVLDGEMVVWFDAYRNQANRRFVARSLRAQRGESEQVVHSAASTWLGSGAGMASPALDSTAVPAARDASVDKFISNALDHINLKLQSGKYIDAANTLKEIGKDLGALDAHQKARWYHMRAVCRWHQDDDAGAAEDFLKAASLCDDDDRLAAARVRGLLLKTQIFEALKAGTDALERFPDSLPLWLATANARICNKEVLSIDDIPAEHRQEADALHLVAWCHHTFENSSEARRLSLAALNLPTANFLTRNIALAFVLDDIVANPINSTFRQLSDLDRADLGWVLAEFEPWFEKLWSWESISTVTDTVYRLAFAYLAIGSLQQAQALIAESKSRGIEDVNIARVEMEALIEAGKVEDALRLGEQMLDTLLVDGLIAFAQVARSVNNLPIIEKVLEVFRTRHPDATTEIDVVTALRWQVMVFERQENAVLTEIEANNSRIYQSIPLLCAAGRILRKAQFEPKAEALVSRAHEILTEESTSIEQYMVASLLMDFRRFNEASRLYELVLPSNGKGTPYQYLLFCYVRSGQRAKAHALLKTFSQGWERDEELRLLAMELGQEAGDWLLLKSLVDAQLEQHPGVARSWLYSLMVAVNTNKDEASAIVLNLPDELEGPIPDQAQLANAEFEHGKPERGVRRLYNMVRRNMGSSEAASAILAAHVWIGDQVIELDQVPDTAAPGVTVTIEDETGHTHVITIDPTDCENLPTAANFCSATSDEGVRLRGLKVGDSFRISDGFGGARHYSITELTSAYRTILTHAQQALRVSLTPSSSMTMLTLETDDEGAPKLDRLTAHLEHGANQASHVLTLYGTENFTLGVIARMLGKDIVTVVKNWPSGSHPLLTGGGLVAERDKAEKWLISHPRMFVVDAATLTELALCGCLHVLKILPMVYVSSKTYSLLQYCLQLAKASRTSGFASAVNGQLVIQEVTQKQIAQEVDFLTSICEAIESNCHVVPAYGKDKVSDELLQVQKVISDEEFSCIMLALEYDATAICLDLRLRLMCDYSSARSVWPQALLMHLAATHRLSARDYSLAVTQMFLRNRSFISLQASDLLMMVYQGGVELDSGIRRFVRHISENSTEFKSAARVALTFLSLIGKSGTSQFGVVIELTERILEGLFRHKECPPNFSNSVLTYLNQPHNMQEWEARSKSFFRVALNSAKNAARRAPHDKPIRATVLYCGSPPHLLSGLHEPGYLSSIETVPAEVDVPLNYDSTATEANEQPLTLTPSDLASPQA